MTAPASIDRIRSAPRAHGETRDLILSVADGVRTPKQIAELTGVHESNVRATLRRHAPDRYVRAYKPRAIGVPKKIPPVSPGDRPPLPPLLPSGEYCPVGLIGYLAAARRAGMFDHEIARHLRVDAHRVIYFSTDEGTAMLARAASRSAPTHSAPHQGPVTAARPCDHRRLA